MFAYILFVFLVALPLVRADGWDDFSNNLATDLAPFLSLFGEQITKQYLSESLTKPDYFIFAMAPMGILTAVVSAIRICGNPSLRAFIGRAQEGAGNAEAELCSSTSRDVCELYNSGGIARVFGRPKILEIIHDPKHDFKNPDDLTAGIYTFKDYVKLFEDPTKGKGKSPWVKETKKSRDAEEAKLDTHMTYAPNLSLNIGIKKIPPFFFKAIALIGLILQLGVLLFAGFATYYLKWGKDGSPVESYACPLMIIGTFLVCGGMFHCAFLIGQSTKEDIWNRNEIDTDNASIMYWVQPGGQIIGDQTFDAFSYSDHKNRLKRYITSRREPISQDSHLGVWAAIGITVSGFVLQFTGLRGIHSAVSIAQLGVVMVMSILRAALRMQRLKPHDNCFAQFPDEILGHELDWLALRIGRNDIENDTHRPAPRSSSSQLSKESDDQSTAHPETSPRYFWRVCGALDENKICRELPSSYDRHNAATKLLAYRSRLASLTVSSTSSTAPARDFKDEMVQVRSQSQQLAALIEATMNMILSKTQIKGHKVKQEWSDATSIFWGIDCNLSEQPKNDLRTWKHPVYLEFTQNPEDVGNPWRLKNRLDLEGILGLWVWSLKSDPTVETTDPLTGTITSTAGEIQSRRIFSTAQPIKSDLKIWLGDDIDHITHKDYYLPADTFDVGDASALWIRKRENNVASIEESALPTFQRARFFGLKAPELSQSQESQAFMPLSAVIKGSLVSACAQEIFASFLESILDVVDDIGPVDVPIAKTIRPENSLVTAIVGLFTEMQLGSRQDALFCVLPLMIPHLKMPSAESALAAARKSANEQRRNKNWMKAETVLHWAWKICTQSQTFSTNTIKGEDHKPDWRDILGEQATIALGELYRCALVDEIENPFGKNGIFWLKKKKPGQSVSVRKVIDRYVDVANRIAEHETSGTDLLTVMEKGCLTSEMLFLLHSASKMENNQKGKALCLAAQHGWTEVVLALLELSSEPDFQDTDTRGRTPLSYAAENGSLGVVRELVENWGSFPNSEDALHRTPLSYASEAGSHMVAELLLRDKRVSPDNRNNDGRTPLSWAAEKGHEAVVKQLLQTEKVDPNAKDNDGRTPLWWAVQNGNESIVTQLLQTETVDPNAVDKVGETPLWWAARNGHKDVMKQLLKNDKVNPDAKDDLNGQTLLSWAAWNGNEAIVTQLLQTEKVDPNAEDKEGRTPLSWAAGKGHKAVMKQLLKNDKVNPEAKDDLNGRTPLCWAAQDGHEAIVAQLLLTEKVDPNAVDKGGSTPLSWAARNGNEAVVKQLLENDKVNPNAKDKLYRRTPLWWAARNGNEAVVKQLLENDKVNPNAKDDLYGRTPLWWAAEKGHKAIVTQLLQTKNVDPDTKDYLNGRTPLWWAARNGNESIVTQLLQTRKVDPNAVDKDGETPLSWAARNGHKDIVKQLLKNDKVNPDAKDDLNGQTLLSWAARKGNEAIVT